MGVSTRVRVHGTGGKWAGVLLMLLAALVLGLFVALSYSLLTLLTMVGFWQVTGALVASMAGTLWIRWRLDGVTKTSTGSGLQYVPRIWPAFLQLVWQGLWVARVALLVAEKPRTAWELCVAAFYLGVLGSWPVATLAWRRWRSRGSQLLLGPIALTWRDRSGSGAVGYDDLRELGLVGTALRCVQHDGRVVVLPLERFGLDRARSEELLGLMRERVPAESQEPVDDDLAPPLPDPFALPTGRKPTLH